MSYKIISFNENLAQIEVLYNSGIRLAIDVPILADGYLLDGAELDAYIKALTPNIVSTTEKTINNSTYVISLIDKDYQAQQQREKDMIETEHLIKIVNANRLQKLKDSDWSQLSDTALSDLEKVVWAEYRQALRDIPLQSTYPKEVIYPIAPNEEAR